MICLRVGVFCLSLVVSGFENDVMLRHLTVAILINS